MTDVDRVGWDSRLGSLWIDVGLSGGSRRGKKRWRVTIAGRVVDSTGNGVADVELQVGK
jgi:hypothetical protein